MKIIDKFSIFLSSKEEHELFFCHEETDLEEEMKEKYKCFVIKPKNKKYSFFLFLGKKGALKISQFKTSLSVLKPCPSWLGSYLVNNCYTRDDFK